MHGRERGYLREKIVSRYFDSAHADQMRIGHLRIKQWIATLRQ